MKLVGKPDFLKKEDLDNLTPVSVECPEGADSCLVQPKRPVRVGNEMATITTYHGKRVMGNRATLVQGLAEGDLQICSESLGNECALMWMNTLPEENESEVQNEA